MVLVGNDFDGSDCRLLCGDVKAKECSCRHRSHSDCEDANDDVTSTCLIRLGIGLFHVPPNEMDLRAAMRAAEKGRSPLVQPSMHQKGISSRVGSALAESSALG